MIQARGSGRPVCSLFSFTTVRPRRNGGPIALISCCFPVCSYYSSHGRDQIAALRGVTGLHHRSLKTHRIRLYFHCVSGKRLERRVRSRLLPPPCSLLPQRLSPHSVSRPEKPAILRVLGDRVRVSGAETEGGGVQETPRPGFLSAAKLDGALSPSMRDGGIWAEKSSTAGPNVFLLGGFAGRVLLDRHRLILSGSDGIEYVTCEGDRVARNGRICLSRCVVVRKLPETGKAPTPCYFFPSSSAFRLF